MPSEIDRARGIERIEVVIGVEERRMLELGVGN